MFLSILNLLSFCRKLLIGVSKSAHATHDAEYVVVRRIHVDR